MIRPTPRSTRTDSRFPDATLFRSRVEPDGSGGQDICYYDSRCQIGDGLLKRAKFSENAILAASWEYVGNEPYASNCPGMTSRGAARALQIDEKDKSQIGRASCRERVCQYV